MPSRSSEDNTSTRLTLGFLTASFIYVLAAAMIGPLCAVPAQAQVVCGSKEYLESLPVPTSTDPNVKRIVQLVNCSDQVLLGAANAAGAPGMPLYPVFPQEKTWVMQPYGSSNFTNVITIDVPPQWYGQFKKHGTQANIWARTGCRYDVVTNRAQCETGDCAGQYDCSSAANGPPNATTLAEWTFYQDLNGFLIDSPDISAVNGANLTIDIAPYKGSDRYPGQPTNNHWLNWNYPLTVHGVDLRDPNRCNGSSGNFAIKRTDTLTAPDPGAANYPFFGGVIVDANGNPQMPTGNETLACLSNCGYFKYPYEKGVAGCDPNKTTGCYGWQTFCAGDNTVTYGQSCSTDAHCQKLYPADLHVACFHNTSAGPNGPGVCEIRAFYKGSKTACNGQPDPQPSGPASTIACTNTYGSINPLITQGPATDYTDQPIDSPCSGVVFPPGGSGIKGFMPCIGDDTMHQVLHGAYTWPNDPQVYPGDSSVYRIIFSPGGNANGPITPAQNAMPLCSTLPDNYNYTANAHNCSGPIDNNAAVFAVARVANRTDKLGATVKWQSTGSDWSCELDQRGSGANGAVCRWQSPAPGNCSPPVTDAEVTQSACGRIDSGTSLLSGPITPNSGDALILQVSVPQVLSAVSLPASVSGCVPSQGMGAWTLVTQTFINNNQGVIAWYRGTANTSVSCNVTVTMASDNPAELKLYDVPKFNGTVELTTSATGFCNNCAAFPSPSAGNAITVFARDLQMGALLLVNPQTTPIVYWTNWLTNGPTSTQCLNGNQVCPTDDGTDYLPGHGPYSGNSDSGHLKVAPGVHYFHRDSNVVSNQSYSWGGSAIYLELNP